MKRLVITLLFACLFSALPASAQQPIPDTVISTGAVSNYSAPYHPAPYVAAGTLITSSTAGLPTYSGIRYELYLDATGKPAYAGMAWIKPVLWHKGRYALFADASLGGAGSVTSISSAFTGGGGIAVQLGKYSATNTPHWELVIEPEARRIPALANGTNAALLVGMAYTFNRPK